jgi:glycogen synthase
VKVLMTADTVGGVWTYAIDLVAALAPYDVEVTLVTAGGSLRRDQRERIASSGVTRLYETRFALEWMPDPWPDVERFGELLLDLASDLEPDLVHVNGFANASLPFGAPVLVVAHSDVVSWHRAVRAESAGPEWRRYREHVAAGLAAADLVVAPTRATLADLRRSYPVVSRTAVIPNGTPRCAVRRPKEPFVLAAGRLWDEAKNIAGLARVAPRLRWPVAVAGDGPAAPGLRALGVLDRRDLDEVLARAAVFAAPAYYEPFGLAALEAGSAGCALVLGDIESLREVWGDAALFAPPSDDDALASALHRVIDDNHLRGRLAERARARAARYTPGAAARGYAAAYRGLVARERVPA